MQKNSRFTFYFLLFGYLLTLGLMSCASKQESQKESLSHEEEIDIRFTDITQEAGISFKHESGAYGEFFMPEIMGGGASFIDYDGDGFEDVLLTGGGKWAKSKVQVVPSLRLFKNIGNTQFKETTAEAGLDVVNAYSFGCISGDIDNDGDQDLYLTTLTKNFLLENREGIFTDISKAAGVQGKAVWSTASIFWDADNDGFLDLYVGNYLVWNQDMDRNIWCSLDGIHDNYCHPNLYEGEQGVFYHNNGDGTFSDMTREAGFLGPNGISPIKTLGLTIIDVEQDGWLDLVVANDMQPDLLFHNKGDGTFEEVGTSAGIAYNQDGKPRAGMGLVAGDMDNSGFESIAVGNFSRQPISVYKALPNGIFIDNAYASRIGKPSFLTLTFGLSLFDADLDGDQDLLAANGHVFTDIQKKAPDISFKQPPHLFMNEGEGTFEDQAKKVGGVLSDSLVARASAVGDIDHDGDLDMLLSENDGPVHLLRNDTEHGYHYLRIKLEGKTVNRDAVGAVAKVYCKGSQQMQRVVSAEGYLSQSERILTFGLGNNSQVDSVRIFWPGGSSDTYGPLTADASYFLQEGAANMTIMQEP
ncbi:MAG: CRTAC1 family protein [Bacteroidota bacterium]